MLHLRKLAQRRLSTSVRNSSSSEQDVDSARNTKMQIHNLKNTGVPIEKISLTRGLAMDKFEKVGYSSPQVVLEF